MTKAEALRALIGLFRCRCQRCVNMRTDRMLADLARYYGCTTIAEVEAKRKAGVQ